MTKETVGAMVDRLIDGETVTVPNDETMLDVSVEIKKRLGTLDGALGYQGPSGEWELCMVPDLSEIESALLIGGGA